MIKFQKNMYFLIYRCYNNYPLCICYILIHNINYMNNLIGKDIIPYERYKIINTKSL